MKKAIQLTFKFIFVSFFLLTTTCKKDELAKVTKLEIGTTSNITETTAMVSAEFIDVSTNVTSFGFCWATISKPEVTDGLTLASIAAKIGEFSISISGLSSNTKYYVRAYAREGDKIIYSTGEISFTTLEAKYINLTAPVASDNWTIGSTQNITWTDNISENVDIILMQGETIALAIVDDTPNSGTYSWEIPAGLSNAANYSIIVRSVSDAGINDESEVFEISETPFITIIAPNTDDNWQKGSTQTISWTDNIDENINIELFKNQVKVSTDGDIALNTASTSPKSWTISSSLTAGTDYTIRITSVDSENINDESANFTISDVLPTVITKEASSITGTTAILNGTVNANGETVNVRFEWGETTAYGNTAIATPATVSGTTVISVSADIMGLTTGTTYHFRLKAGNAYGDDMSFPTSIPKPTTFTLPASSVMETTALLNGTVNANDYETTVTFEYGTTNSYGTEINATPNLVTGSTETNVSASLANLLASTTYHYRVKAENSGGISYGDDVEFTTSAFYINVVSPTNGDHWITGSTHNINWDDNIGENVTIALFKNNLVNKVIVSAPGTLSNGIYAWTLETDLTYSENYIIRVTSIIDETVFGESPPFTISDEFGTATDWDGNIYKTIKIGNQWWMAENLRVTHYYYGTEIPLVSDNVVWANLLDNATDDAYSYYDNSNTIGDNYGALYTWAAAMGDDAVSSSSNPSGVQGVCPTGWHLPSDEEWKQLEMYLGMGQADADATNWRGTHVGDKLKETGTSHWVSPNTGATNEYGFFALPGGGRSATDGSFIALATKGYWWSATESSSIYGWNRHLANDNSGVYRYDYFYKSNGFSVRCVKD